ncbi:uncharacterized protein PFB0765w-like isoform X2 [Phoenix dactylifera]|uniref:Uncharacterized protein PFB0765w-like isoform X2 n=1 Tax=Phoenix dactylifera TaxID=42345 RepID=A0A8B8ZSA4_PHODC|nr:uncharacterized protein PFB0765w-like isoform X2 [Phoenix dactylifera]XP_038975204.1 uncharacterized protein PFB0765w-like isoform X2 [Phoenix dactylifera]
MSHSLRLPNILGRFWFCVFFLRSLCLSLAGLSYGLKYLSILVGSSSKRVRGKTVGKGIDKLIAQNGREKLSVPILDEWNALCGINAPKNSSSSSTPSRVSQDHIGELQKLKAEMEEMKMEREELRRQLEQERREHEEEKKEREEEQKQIAHLTSLVTEFLKEKTQTHKSSIHHDGAMYSTGGTNTR